MLTEARYTEITGTPAPEGFAVLVSRVASRLEMLLQKPVDEGALAAGLDEAVAFGVQTLSAPSDAAVPAGVSSMSVGGEYSVSVSAGHVIASDGALLPERFAYLSELGGRCVTVALRHRRVAL